MLDILQHIQALDPSQHGAVGYLVQHTLEHIQHKRHPVEPEVKRRSVPEHRDVLYSVGLIMKHKRWVPVCVKGKLMNYMEYKTQLNLNFENSKGNIYKKK